MEPRQLKTPQPERFYDRFLDSLRTARTEVNKFFGIKVAGACNGCTGGDCATCKGNAKPVQSLWDSAVLPSEKNSDPSVGISADSKATQNPEPAITTEQTRRIETVAPQALETQAQQNIQNAPQAQPVASIPTFTPSSLDFASALLSRNLREGAKVNGIYPIAQQLIDPNFLSQLNSPVSDSTPKANTQTEAPRTETLVTDITTASTPQFVAPSILDAAPTQLTSDHLASETQRTETAFAGVYSNIHFPPNIISPVTAVQIQEVHSIPNAVSDPISLQRPIGHERVVSMPVIAPLTLQNEFAVGLSSPVAVVSRTPREYVPTLETPHARPLGFLPKPQSSLVTRIKEMVRAKEEAKPKEGEKPPEIKAKKNTKVAAKEEVSKAPVVAKPAVAAKSPELQNTTNVKAKTLETKAIAPKAELVKSTSIKITFVEDPQFAYAKRALAEFKLRLSGISPVFSSTGFFCSSMNPKIDNRVSKFSLYYLLGLIGPKKPVRSRGNISGLINRLLRKISS